MRKGFSLVELLVVLGISVMLTGIAIVYSGIGQNQVALSVETAKLAQSILRAKNLAIATYNEAPGTCGYGVSIDIANNEYSLFSYNPTGAPPCPTVASSTAAGISSGEEGQYSATSWNVPLATGVHIVSGGAGNDLAVVVFYPPDPATLLSRTGSGGAFMPSASAVPLTVTLRTTDGSMTSVISVSPAGQVSF